MKLPIPWIKDYIDIDLTPEKLADALTLSGNKVEYVEKINGESVIEIEVTTNRPDTLSLLGLAREIAALSGKKIRWPKVTPSQTHGKKIDIRVQDKKACPLYTARLIENVTIAASSTKIKNYLALMGSHGINNAVDVTNFVLFETGQPLHVFDADRIAGGTIVVRYAEKGEKFLGLDGIEYTLDEKTLVIADAEKPIAIAGVIGGKLAEVNDRTKNILLESAYFDPLLVRQASKRHKVSTESSYRFERGVEMEGVAAASARAAGLIHEACSGKEASYRSVGSVKKNEREVVLRFERVERLLGIKISPSRIRAILKSLGFGLASEKKDCVSVLPPGFRRDVTQEADLIEEILRIQGFDKIPVTLPLTRHPLESLAQKKATAILELKKYLAAAGFNEIITYSLLSQKTLKNSGFEPDAKGIHRIVNAVSAEQEYIRPSLLPGTLETLVFNIHRKAGSLKLFEIGNRYSHGREETMLALAVYGKWEENWRRKSDSSLYDLKGAVESVLHSLKVVPFCWQESMEPSRWFDNWMTLEVAEQSAGQLGSVSREILGRLDIPQDVYFAEIDLGFVFKKSETVLISKVKPTPKFPQVRRDIAFVVDEKIPVGALEDAMRQSGEPFLQEARLFDEYKGKNIASGKRSLAFSLSYQKETGTFTEDEILGIQNRVGQALKDKYHVEFR